ncbi:hypothetical protein K438DRAFT_1706974 [Mycena galopus ATCC 62051]|nr:hypothetical protein K438DRAFT_1706974 [Mycena galopus ATCC 62051]
MMAASATWQQSPSRILASNPTVLSDPQLLAPRTTPSPTVAAAIEIFTTVVIPDYFRFYDQPTAQFSPVYSTLPDGSLITPPFVDDLTRSYLSLLVTAMLATLFLRNIIVCFDYLRRAKMKRRALFYLLLSSQLLSMGLAPLLGSYFSVHLDCAAVMSVASTTTGISLALLMTGVLGLKAYRCLDNSRIVLLVLVTFFCASSVFLGLSLSSTHGVRRLSGGCSAISQNPRFIRIYVLIQLAHSAFLSSCFFYTVWKSRASPAARGRLSLCVTLDDFPNVKSDRPVRRGWWEQLLGHDSTLPTPDLSGDSTRRDPFDRPHSISSQGQRRPASRYTISDPILEPLNPVQEVKEPGAPHHRPTSISRLIPRMELFHKVMKDELCYTTTITVTTVILALLLVFGVNFDNGLDVIGWVSTNWAIISVLVIHSFGRVIRRHEKEALLQNPSAWWHERDINHRSPYSRRAFPSQLRIRMPEDPFSDARAIRDSMSSWNSEFANSPSSPSPVASTRDRKPSLTSPYPSSRNTLLYLPPDSTDPSRSSETISIAEEKSVNYGP